MSNLQSTTRA
uniref:Uncharacterized protein n=1 Tax=Arundo donax TaxID=35708 RepID=A0A0A8ZWJ1_ARUDO